MKKRVVILGGGISGLSLAYFLAPYCSITILEKEARVGGWLKTEHPGGFLFEQGPRTFRKTERGALFSLAQELGLGEELLFSAPDAKKRYLWLDKRLQKFPQLLLKKRFLLPLCTEWRKPKIDEEETIAAFAERRFGREVAEALFDPIALGIYAGDIHQLSFAACFPQLKALEKEHGSLTRALFAKKKKEPSPLFSFKGGVEVLVETLARKLKREIHLNQQVKALDFSDHAMQVITQDRTYPADFLISALPPQTISELFKPWDPRLAALLKIKMQGIHVVNLGYARTLLPISAFGYLVPTREREEVLGVVFDSAIFPEQNRYPEETRLTVMVREGAHPQRAALKAVESHLGISQAPDLLKITAAKEAIPQYELGHERRLEEIEERRARRFPACRFIGNYLSGVSVEECIAVAKRSADVLLQSLTASTR